LNVAKFADTPARVSPRDNDAQADDEQVNEGWKPLPPEMQQARDIRIQGRDEAQLTQTLTYAGTLQERKHQARFLELHGLTLADMAKFQADGALPPH
jgi:hypothetical protein